MTSEKNEQVSPQAKSEQTFSRSINKVSRLMKGVCILLPGAKRTFSTPDLFFHGSTLYWLSCVIEVLGNVAIIT